MKILAALRLIGLLLITALLPGVRTAKACDACSSNMGSFYPGFVDVGNSFVSFSSTARTYGVYIPSGYRWMNSFNMNGAGHHHPKFERSAYYDQVHVFHELRFSYSLKKVTFGVTAPLVQKKLLRNSEEVENNTGIGDVRVMALYRAVNRRNSTGAVSNRLFIGGGFSLPTGASSKPGYEGAVEPSRQTGIGTFGFFVQAVYQLNVKRFGFIMQPVFQTADANSKGYRFGNAFNFSARAYYEVKINQLVITPGIGVNVETAAEDRVNGKRYELDTGGKRVWCPAGIDIFYKSVGATFTWYLPISEELKGLQFESKRYFSAGIRYVFKKT